MTKDWVCGLVFGVGLTLGVGLIISGIDHGAIVPELTAEETRDGYIRTEATSALIEVRFLSPAEIQQKTGDPGTRAFTQINGDLTGPCRIYLPTGMAIVFNRASHRAIWARGSDSNTVAHEILHCLRWNWHDDE